MRAVELETTDGKRFFVNVAHLVSVAAVPSYADLAVIVVAVGGEHKEINVKGSPAKVASRAFGDDLVTL
jgi:hypothetical protein